MPLGAGGIVKDEAFAVGREGEGDVQHLGIGQRLLHAVPWLVLVVLGLDHGEGNAGPHEQYVIGLFVLAPPGDPSPHPDRSLGQS